MPVNVCGNPVNGPLGIAAASECDNQQDNVTVHSSEQGGDPDGDSVVVGNGSGNDVETQLGDVNTNAPVNVCANPVNAGGLVAGSQCRNDQNNPGRPPQRAGLSKLCLQPARR